MRAAVLIIGPALVVFVWMGLGVLSLPGLALLAACVTFAGFFVLPRKPQILLVVGPALMPFPLLWIIFPYEIAFGLFSVLLVLRMIQVRAIESLQLSAFETANLAFVVWALFTGFWSPDGGLFLLGARRLVEGWFTMWVAYRIAAFVDRRWFEAGIMMCVLSLSGTALWRQYSQGLSEAQLYTDRASATDLGWGTANFIASLFLVTIPPILVVALRSRDSWMRILAWLSVALAGVLQVLIASRAAAVLFLGGGFIQIAWTRLRRRGLAIVAWAVIATALLLSPVGEMFLSRFSNPRDLGSIVIRFWYWRVAWQRTVDHQPWGMGLNQGAGYSDHLADVDPHNYWLVLGSELGGIGTALWIAVQVVLWLQLRAMQRTPGWETMSRALMVGFWLSQLHTLVEPTFQGVQYQYLYFWVFGGYLGYHAHTMRSTGMPVPRPAAPAG
jgi:hypothetical protein